MNYIFDLDATLYQDNGEHEAHGEKRIYEYFMAHLGVSEAEAVALQQSLKERCGTVLDGVSDELGLDKKDYLEYICKTDISHLPQNPELNGLLYQLNGRKLIYSNSTKSHILEALELIDCDANLFERIFVAEDNNFCLKHKLAAFENFCRQCNLNPQECVIFEDSIGNLKNAKLLGMTTVLILPQTHQEDFIDYHFANINQAIKAFI